MTELEALEWCKQHEAKIDFHKHLYGGTNRETLEVKYLPGCSVTLKAVPVFSRPTFLEAVLAVKHYVDAIENPQPLKENAGHSPGSKKDNAI